MTNEQFKNIVTIYYGEFLQELDKGASRFFNKVEHGASKFFNKTVPQLGDKVGGEVSHIGGEVGGGMKKVGGFLKNNAGIISDGVAAGLMATGFGAPLAGAVLAAGNSGQAIGAKLQNSGNRLQSGSKAAGASFGNQVNSYSGLAGNLAQNKLNKISNGVNANLTSAGSAMTNAINRSNDVGVALNKMSTIGDSFTS